jgi:hypothetical protein
MSTLLPSLAGEFGDHPSAVSVDKTRWVLLFDKERARAILVTPIGESVAASFSSTAKALTAVLSIRSLFRFPERRFD